ncbi:nitroreductase/quinone reductase family protein [Streptomyces sp. NPDC051913]|uniref:nitroreductase/quinone reductase family protein n=1 Tax=Streptomyces sp. NPDC051913 TaxID=3365676 RepID=UPI0037D0452B
MTEEQADSGLSWNERVIQEFRANNGRVGGMFEGAPMVVLTTMGRKTGKPHVNPAIYYKDGDRYLVFASNAGRGKNPDWYHNLLDSPQVTMEIGTEEGAVRPYATRAQVLEGEERDRYWELQCSLDPAFREYEEKAGRAIPVVALHPLDLGVITDRSRMIGTQLLKHHADLRAELARVRAAVDETLTAGGADPGSMADLSEQLRKHCLTYCYGLQMHHIREDGSFSAFEKRFPHLVPAITRLREEHKVVEAALAEFEELLDKGGFQNPDDVARLRAELDRVVGGLEDHFRYEEETLLPALEV